MKDMRYAILLAAGAIGIVGVVVTGAMDGQWWRLFLLLTLWPMGQAAKVIWCRGFKNKPHEYGTRQPDRSPDGRGEWPTDPNELAKWIVDQTVDDDPGRNSHQRGDQST